MYTTQPLSIRIIARPKPWLFGEHWGVHLPDGRVIHLTPDGVSLVSYDEFCAGKTPRVVHIAPDSRYLEIMRRVHLALSQRPAYHLTEQNCETFASWLIGDTPQSPQVKAFTVIGLLAAVLYAAG